MINNSVKRIISLSNESRRDKYHILTFPTHERYETQLCKTGHEFYSFNMQGRKKWNEKQCPVPQNYHILPDNELASYLNYDFILSQSKFGQFQIASQIAPMLNIPIISLEHTLPLYGVQQEEQIIQMQKMIGNVNIFISEFSQNAWNIGVDSHVIHHGIDIESFKPLQIEKQNHILSVANDFINRDYCLNFSGWKRVTDGLNRKVIGDTEGLSEAAKSTEELIEEYNKCSVFFNSSTLSPIPTSLLEAMSCGCAVVSTATCMIPSVIQNGVNGFISNDESELRKYLELLLKDEELRKTIGNNARTTILEKFSEIVFINNWNTIFNETYEVFNR
jgi:glycosyltransferase involved in cell wall biosynthesis